MRLPSAIAFLFLTILSFTSYGASRVFTGQSTQKPPTWDDAANWKDGVPQDNDDVVIGSNSEVFHVNVSGRVTLKSLTLTRSTLSGANNVTLTTGTLTCSGCTLENAILTVNDSGKVSGGAGGEPGLQLHSCTVENGGTFDLAKSSTLDLGPSTQKSTFSNNGVLTLSTNSIISSADRDGQFNNAQVLRVNAGESPAAISGVIFDNSGLVEVSSGTLDFYTGSTVTGGGSWATDGTNCVVRFGFLNLNLVKATFSGKGPVVFESSTLTITNIVDIETLDASFLTVRGPGGLRLNGESNWRGALFEGGITVNVAPQALFRFTNETVTVDCVQFDNQGTVSQGGNGVLDIRTQFFNGNGADLFLANSGSSGLVDASGTNSPTLVNQGTITTFTHTNQFKTVFRPFLQNSGKIEIGSVFKLVGGSKMSGEVNGAPDLSDDFELFFIEFGGGTNSLEDGFKITGEALVSAGTVIANGAVQVQQLRLDGGTIDGTGNLKVDTFSWLFGTLQGPGTIDCRLVVLESIEGTRHWRGRTMSESGGGVEWYGGDIDAGDGATLVINDGFFSIYSDRVWTTTSGTSTIQNHGHMTKEGGLGTATISATVENAGTIEEGFGRLRILKLKQTAGKTTVAAKTTLQAGSADIQSGTLGGNGTVVGPVTNGGTTSPGKSPGILTIQGSYTQTISGNLQIELAGLTPGDLYDRLDVLGPASLDGSLDVTLLNAFVPSLGDRFEVMRFTSQSGSFAVNNGLRLGTNLLLAPIYSATNLVLVVTNGTFLMPSLSANLNFGNSLKLSWDTASAQIYQVQVSSNLADWLVLTNISGGGGPFDFVIPIDRSNPRQYFRLR